MEKTYVAGWPFQPPRFHHDLCSDGVSYRAFEWIPTLRNYIAYATALLSSTAVANAEIFYLEIDGVIEMQGPCVFDPMGGGDFFWPRSFLPTFLAL